METGQLSDHLTGNEQRNLHFGIISHEKLTWSEHRADIIETGLDGFSIETSERIGPGYLWFRQRICGHRAGVLEWCRPSGAGYLARVRFVPLSWNMERYVTERARRSLAHQPLRDPAEIIARGRTPNDSASRQ